MKLLQKIKNGTINMLVIWRQELTSILKDEGAMLFIFFLCLAYPLLYAFLYGNEVIREVPVIIVDENNTTLSREFSRNVDATADVQIIEYATDMEAAQEAMRQQQAYGIIYIPQSFSSDIAQLKQTHISIFCDMSGLLYYKAILSSCTDISLKMNKEIKINRLNNTTDQQDEISTAPIKYEEISIFNPQKGMSSFLIPAVLILILQQSLLLSVGISAGTARENNYYRDLVPHHRDFHGTLRMIIGKGLVYLMIYSVLSAYILIAVPKIFHLIQLADFKTIAAFTFPYILACIFFAMTASIAIRNRETCMLIFVFTSLPLLFISGISWPQASIPNFWKYVSWIFPSTFGINGFVRINSMGASLHDVKPEFQALWIQTGIYFITTFFVYRHQIILTRRHAFKRLKRIRKVTWFKLLRNKN